MIVSTVLLVLCLLAAGIFLFGGWKITVTPRGDQNMQVGYGETYTDSGADAVLTGPETHSSSPVRILRDETLQSSLRGLYPCGEGAGYAGGITSAAMDGVKVAERVAALLGISL